MAKFIPQNEDFQASVKRLFDATGMHKHLGITLTSLEPGMAVAHMDWRPELTQQHLALHAGALITLADAVAGCAAWSLLAEGENLVSVNISASLMRLADTKRVRGEGRVIKPGTKFYFCEGVVFDDESTESKPLITCAVTIAVI